MRFLEYSTPNLHAAAIQDNKHRGWTITNQLVYNVAASRRGHTAKLRKVLNGLGVLCYYTFSVKGFEENYAVFTPNSRSLQEKEEEKRWGKLSAEQEKEFLNLLRNSKDRAAAVQRLDVYKRQLKYQGI